MQARKPQRKPKQPVELLSRGAVLQMLGGDKPLHISTLYRWMESGRFPRPVKVGGSVRWVKAECEAVLRDLVDARRAGGLIP
jgi:prophage regulatory protein